MAKESKKVNVEKEAKEAKTFEYKEEVKEENVEINKQDDKYNILYNQFLRLQADFDNYKRRNAGVASSMYNDGVNEALISILPTMDSLDMAIAAQVDDNQKKGIELVKKAFMDVMAKYNVEEIKALDEKFDPNIHEAVMNKDDPENAGKVVQVLRTGYKRGDKVLRHSMCVVGQ